jgi:CheY-like chemotaxis protein
VPESSRSKVLVVEDDAQLARLYVTALALRGIGAVRVADGIAALRSLEEQRPDLVLLDLMLPVLDGRAVLREFAANPLVRDIPVVVVTGVDPVPELPHAVAVLSKPLQADEVARVVEEHLSARSRN